VAIGCDEPFIPISQAPHLKLIQEQELCSDTASYLGGPCARSALAVSADRDQGVSASVVNERMDCSGP
jgi:hypothetical protein